MIKTGRAKALPTYIKGGKMTYSNLKQRIYDLLDLRVETGVSNGSIVEAVGSALDGAVSSAQ